MLGSGKTVCTNFPLMVLAHTKDHTSMAKSISRNRGSDKIITVVNFYSFMNRDIPLPVMLQIKLEPPRELI